MAKTNKELQTEINLLKKINSQLAVKLIKTELTLKKAKKIIKAFVDRYSPKYIWNKN